VAADVYQKLITMTTGAQALPGHELIGNDLARYRFPAQMGI
jgi:hypothetical protein